MRLAVGGKQTMTGKQLDEMNDKFEDIEHEQFGSDSFTLATESRGFSAAWRWAFCTTSPFWL